MAIKIFLKIEGVEGESRDKEHKKEIDVLSWSWGMAQSAVSHAGTSSSAGKVLMEDLSIIKYFDKSSAKLMLGCASGQHFSKATLTAYKTSVDQPQDYLLMELSHVMITSIATDGSGEEDRPTENVTLKFATVKITYTPYNEHGEPEEKAEFGWDIETNVSM